MDLSFLSQSVQSAKLEIVGIHIAHPHTTLLTHVSAFPLLQGRTPTAAVKVSLLPHCVLSYGHKAISAVLLKDVGTRFGSWNA